MLLVLVLGVAGGCQTLPQEKGNILDAAALARIEPGRTTRTEVLSMLGSPTFVNSFRNERWAYIQDRRFGTLQEVNRVVIVFDADGKVSQVERNFADTLHDPETRAEADSERRHGWWRRLWYRNPTTAREGSTVEELAWWRLWEQESEAQALAERRAAEGDPLSREESARKGVIDRLLDLRMPDFSGTTPRSGAMPDTTEPSPEGWWQGVFPRDPAQENNAHGTTGDDDAATPAWLGQGQP
ncbi:MAG: outer membrane protein assembly factor BamE [Magnetococcus sp. WYHC-3]